MNYKILLVFFIFLYSCTSVGVNKSNNVQNITSKYSNKGFALVYKNDFNKKKIISKKIDERSLIIFQRNLKKNTAVKIVNLINNKSILAKVGSKSDYPKFYNSVLSQRISDELELDEHEPYVEITTISDNSTFVVKKAKMYDEEREVADKAPVDGISISDLSLTKVKIKNKNKKNNFKYIIKIADFYYKKSAVNMQLRIENELNLHNSKIKELSTTIFRVYLGPFNNLKSLKKAFDDINPLNFENIEIIKI